MSSNVFHLSMRASERLRGRGRLFLPELFFGRRGIVGEVHNLCKFWMWLEIQYMVSSTMYVTFAQSTLRFCFWFGCRPNYYQCEQSSKDYRLDHTLLQLHFSLLSAFRTKLQRPSALLSTCLSWSSTSVSDIRGHAAVIRVTFMTLCIAACFTRAGFLGAMYFLPFFRLADFCRLEGDLLCRPLVLP